MKPHLRMRYGVWSCITLAGPIAIGCGRTPIEAYAEWQADCLRVGRFQ
jgi:hypothetical protein